MSALLQNLKTGLQKWFTGSAVNYDVQPTTLLIDPHLRGGIKSQTTGNLLGYEYDQIIYQGESGFGSYEVDCDYIILHFKLARLFPLIVLNHVWIDTLGQKDMPHDIQNLKNLKLEGGFNKTYEVRVFPDTQTTVLDFMTPDLMDELLKIKNGICFELWSDQLFVIRRFSGLTAVHVPPQPEDYQQAEQAATILLKHIDQLSKSWLAGSMASEIQQMVAPALNLRQQAVDFRSRQL